MEFEIDHRPALDQPSHVDGRLRMVGDELCGGNELHGKCWRTDTDLLRDGERLLDLYLPSRNENFVATIFPMVTADGSLVVQRLC